MFWAVSKHENILGKGIENDVFQFFFLGSSESPATALQKKCAQGDSPGVPPRFSQGNLTAMALTIPPGISTGTPPEFFQ